MTVDSLCMHPVSSPYDCVHISNVDDHWNQPRRKNVYFHLLCFVSTFLSVMSGRDSLLCGFEANRSYFGTDRSVRLMTKIRACLPVIECALRLGVPDCAVFNSLILIEEFVYHRSSTSSPQNLHLLFKLALRFSVFHRQRSDILSYFPMVSENDPSYTSTEDTQILRVESELLAFSRCRVWLTQGNVFETLQVVVQEAFPNFKHAERLWDVSSSVCWILLDSELIHIFDCTASVCIATIACATAVLGKCRAIEKVIYPLLGIIQDNVVIKCPRVGLIESTTRLLMYIVD